MVGVVLLNFNTPEDVFQCVTHIHKQTSQEYKIYIVDNASSDGSFSQFEAAFAEDSKIELHASPCNNGFSAGNNIGIRKAIADGCDYVCVINADIVLLNDAISILVDKMEKDPTIGVAAPVIVVPNESRESQYARNKLTFGAYLSEKTFFGKINSFQERFPRYQIVDKEFDADYKFFGMTYGCMYVARSRYLAETGMLDEDVFLFNEEDIMAYKLEAVNMYTLISPEAKVLHNHHSSVGRTSVANRTYHLRISALIVLRKYGCVSRLWLVPIMMIQGLDWMLRARKYDDFKAMERQYHEKHLEILKIPKGSGIKYLKPLA